MFRTPLRRLRATATTMYRVIGQHTHAAFADSSQSLTEGYEYRLSVLSVRSLDQLLNEFAPFLQTSPYMPMAELKYTSITYGYEWSYLTVEDWCGIIKETRQGFKDYVAYVDNIEKMTSKQRVEGYHEIQRRLHISFTLLHRYWANF